MAHHGAETKSTGAFIDEVKPKFAFCSSYWAGRPPNHPRCSVIDALTNHAGSAKQHDVHCYDGKNVVSKSLKNAIWSTIPGPDDTKGYIIAIEMGADNEDVLFESRDHSNLPGVISTSFNAPA